MRVTFDEAQWELSAPALARGPVRGVPSSTTAADPLADAIASQDFELVDDLEIAARPATRAAPTTTPTVEVPVPIDQHAIMLVARDDVYEWVLPDAAPQGGRRLRNGPSASPRSLTFTLPLARSATTRGLGALAGGSVRAWVLRFAARALTPIAIGFLERKVETRFVDMKGPAPLQWPTAADFDGAVSSPRVLLFVHGTFSSTIGAYHALAATEEGRAFFAWACTRYDEIIGYDHATLSVDPLANAKDLHALLARRYGDAQPIIDVVAHSRGGLVARALVEMVAPGEAWRPRFDRVVMAGCTNGGTHLAEPQNWKTFVDLYTNLVTNAVRVIGGTLGHAATAALIESGIRSVGAMVKYLAVHAIEDRAIPGLAAMRPGSELVTELNRTNPGQADASQSMYFVVQTEYEPTGDGGLPRALLAWLGDRITDQFFQTANDLVVDTASMTAIDPSVGGFVKDVLDFGKTDFVHHTSYFAKGRTAETLQRWLGGDAHVAATSPRRMRGARANGGGPKRARPTRGEGGAELETAPPPAVGNESVVTPPPLARLECRAEMPAQIPVNQRFELTVILSREAIAAAGPDAVAGTAVADADPGKTLSISVSPRANVDLEDPWFEENIAFPEPGTPRELFFHGRALAEGPAQLWVYVRQNRAVLAKITIDAQVVATPAASVKTTARADVTPGAAVTCEAPCTLRVFEIKVGSEMALQFELEAEKANLRLAFTADREPDLPTFVNRIYDEIEKRRLQNANDTATFLLELQAYGATLFRSLLPLQLQNALWQHRGDIDSILVLSTETHVPWELLHICDPATGTLPNEQCFLAQKGLVRWLHNNPVQPEVLAVRDGKTRHIVPDYPTQQWQLPATKREREFVAKHFGTTSVGDAASDLYALLKGDADFDLLHYAGHGEAQAGNIDDAAILMLGKGITPWEPDRAKAVVVRALPLGTGNRRPFVFLNACQVGRQGQIVGTIGGFAQAFLARGAGVFVAPLWAVGDQPAFEFGEALYRGFFHDGLTLADAATAARKAAAAAGDATWLAYSVYGHHEARAQVEPALAARWT
ncbi:MAG TPA: CHAT domain-containing protein [Nannocystaceae bacterium]|nr:CHAT domain-containing protein [Nannocystaceae bacterium]